jgi:AcrR family transcriptional regulator
MNSRYHHGDLRRAVLEQAAEVIGRDGIASLSLRSIADVLGVSHTAPMHHFGSREGVLDALAVEGFELLQQRLETAAPLGFLEVGVAYVEFAVGHPGHFAVMYAPDMLDRAQPALSQARAQTFAALLSGTSGFGEDTVSGAAAATAAWSLVHGLAILILSGSLEESGLRRAVGDGDVGEVARRAAAFLFVPESSA